MSGLDLHLERSSKSAVDLTLQLDARQPFLNDHRPGGLPLLGTAMGIELMARAAQHLDGYGAVSACSIADVEILDALVLDGPTATVHVRAEQAEHSNGSIRCVVESRRVTGAPIRHFVGFVQRRQRETIVASVHDASASQPTDVSQDKIYRTFFHGPAFRVIRSARLLEAAMVCELSADLPPLSLPIDETLCAAPRWIELCMQTAGLLEIAVASRMMIPRRIERVDVVEAGGSAAAGPLVACARRSMSPATGDAAFDIDLVDARGVVLVRITGYHTRPLPYPADPEAVRALHDALGQAPTML